LRQNQLFKVSSDNPRAARAWFDTPDAAAWREREAALLATILPRLTGYRGMQIGAPLPAPEICACVGTLRFWRADLVCGPHADVCIDGQNLPWMSGSVDALIVVHGLELSLDPQALVRECVRVLSPRGQVVCLVFNPLSLWAGAQRLRRAGKRFTPRAMPPRAVRLSDWLRLFDLETTGFCRYGVGLPLFGRRWPGWDQGRWLEPLAWTAPGYALVARRRIPPRRLPLRDLRLLTRRKKRALAPATTAGSSRS
jgi:SAM-dependent methyltransferase